MDAELRNRIKRVAKTRHWSLSQTLLLFIDRYWADWEKELGIDEADTPNSPDSES